MRKRYFLDEEAHDNRALIPHWQKVLAWVLALVAFGLLAILVTLPAKGTLSVTVQYGFLFPLNPPYAPMSYQNFNALVQQMTFQVNGTVGGGTNGGIAPDSITGIQMIDSFPDGGVLNLPVGKTTGWNTANPRQLAVNTAGIVDSYSGLTTFDTNALTIKYDPGYFTLGTNSLGNGSTNLTSSNTGSGISNWFTLQPHVLSDVNIAPGGISNPSITNNGLADFVLNEQQIYTNVYALVGGNWTNTVTNLNTIVVGNTNLHGIVAQLGPGIVVSNVQTIYPTNSGGITYFATDSVPTLEVPAFNGSLPLEVNVGTWTNVVNFPNGNGPTNWTGTNVVLQAYEAGGLGPYTNYWYWWVYSSFNGGGSQSIAGAITNAAGNGTNAPSVIFVGTINMGNVGNYQVIAVSNVVYDATGQRAQTVFPALIGFHHN